LFDFLLIIEKMVKNSVKSSEVDSKGPAPHILLGLL
jgi:hypothetical protein